MSSIEPVKALYAAFAKGDIPAALATMSSDIVWNEAENYPYADLNPHKGPNGVLTGVFARIGADCLVGANALVTEGKSFPDGSLIVGAPAKGVRTLDAEALERLRGPALGYVGNARRFAAGLVRLDP